MEKNFSLFVCSFVYLPKVKIIQRERISCCFAKIDFIPEAHDECNKMLLLFVLYQKNDVEKSDSSNEDSERGHLFIFH